MISLPQQSERTWLQANNSDLFGNVSVTKNITFDQDGYLRLSYSPRSVMDETVDADFGEPAVIIRSSDYGFFTQTDELAFQIDDDEILAARPTQIATAGVPPGNASSDAVFSGGLMIVTDDDDVDFYNPATNAWTDTDIVLTTSSVTNTQHPIENFVSLSAVAISDVSSVKLYNNTAADPFDASPTLLTTLNILSDFVITSTCYFNQNLYIGTINSSGANTFMYVWNGFGTAAQSAYEVDSCVIYDVCVHQDSVVLFAGNGQLLRFNGSGFDVLDSIPRYFLNQPISDEANIELFHNMLKSNGDLLYININDEENSLLLADQPQGIWCYDSALGFMYHRYSPSNALTLPDGGTLNATTNQISATAVPVTGTEVIFKADYGTQLLGDIRSYFVIKVDATNFKVAETYSDAIAGTAIDFTGAGGLIDFVFFPNTDFGQFAIGETGALCVIKKSIEYPSFGTDIIWSAEVAARDSLTATGRLGSVSTAVESRGYFITPKIFSPDVTSTYNEVTLKFSPFISSTCKIIIKYRTTDDMVQFINPSATRWHATWTSTTTFTTTEPLFATAEIGNEVEFLRGAAGGLLAHITDISEAGGTYTVTIDETYANYVTGDVSNFVFRNWIKWKEIAYGDSDAESHYLRQQLGAVGKFLQLKVELRGAQTRIEELLVDDVYRLPARGR